VKESSRVLALFLLVIIEAIFEPIDLSLSLFQCLSPFIFFIPHTSQKEESARRRSTIYYTRRGTVSRVHSHFAFSSLNALGALRCHLQNDSNKTFQQQEHGERFNPQPPISNNQQRHDINNIELSNNENNDYCYS
jgi:hypothetical protein